MALRSSLPVYMVGMLGTATLGLSLGYGLGQYTVTGMDPFLGIVRSAQSTASYRPDIQENEFSAARFASNDDFKGAFDPPRPSY